MNICIIGRHRFLKTLARSLEKEGHFVLLNQFSKIIDVVLVQNHWHYIINKYLKDLKKKNIKIINLILDIPIYRLQRDFIDNSKIKYFQQMSYDIFYKNRYINLILDFFSFKANKNKTYKRILIVLCFFFNTRYNNRVYYQKNYKKYLKSSDLNLSISKFTQKNVKRFLKINTKVWYIGVNSDILLDLPKSKNIEYDAINISQILWWKRQEIFVDAAKRLGLKILIIGPHIDKKIKLICPHLYLEEYISVLKYLSKTNFYVDSSIFEGFGMTPVEAAFLDKISIVSNTYVHREILGDYPLYFKRDNVDDLVEKMKLVIEGKFTPNKSAIEIIKKKYSLNTSVSKLLEHIKSIL